MKSVEFKFSIQKVIKLYLVKFDLAIYLAFKKKKNKLNYKNKK